MATLTGTNLLDSIIDSTGIEPNALIYATLSARLQQMIDNGTYSKLAASLVISGFSTQINDATEALDLADTIETNVALIESAADDAAVDAIDFPDYGGLAPITYTLTASAAQVNEGDANTFTVEASRAVEADTDVVFQLRVDADGDTAQLTDFNAGAFNPVTVTIAAGETTATFDMTAITNDGTEVSEKYTMEATVAAETLSTQVTILDGDVGGGQTFTLTTGLDIIPGMEGSNENTVTSGDDLIIGVMDSDVAANSTLNTTDLIDAGESTDTLKVVAVGTSDTTVPTNFENIEVLQVQSTETGLLTVDTSGVTGLTDLNITKAAGIVAAKAAGTTDIDVSMKAAGAAVGVVGGNTVNVSLTDVAAAADIVTIGTGTAAKGDVTVDMTGVAYTAGTTTILSAINVTGGQTISVTQHATSDDSAAATDTAVGTFTQGAVSVTGNALTTQVTVTQDAAVIAEDGVVAVDGVATTQEISFGAMTAGQTISLDFTGGILTFTASKDLTAAEVASAFANLENGDIQCGASAELGIYTNTLDGALADAGAWTSGDVIVVNATTSKVVFSNADNTVTPIADNASTGPVTVAGAVVGTNEVSAVTGVMGVSNGAVSIDDSAGHTITTIVVDGYGAGSDIGGGTATTMLADLTLQNAEGTADMTVADTAATLELSLENLGDDAGDAVLTFTAAPTTLNVTSTGDNYVNLTAAATETLNVSGTGLLDVDATGLAAVKTVTVSDSAGLKLNGAESATLESVDTTGTTGTVTATIAGDKATYTGGAGVDNVIVSNPGTAISNDINLGDGDDRLDLTAATPATPTKVLEGGAGDDTLVLAAGDAATLSAASTFEAWINSFEKLEVAAVGAAATVNLDNLDDIDYVITTGATGDFGLTLDKMTNGATVEIIGSHALSLSDAGVTVALTDATGTSDSLNLVANAAETVDGIMEDLGEVTADGIETINITVNDTDIDPVIDTDAQVSDNKLTLDADKVTSMDLAGDGNFTLVLDTATKAVATIDASDMTGALTVTTLAGDAGATTVTGGSGADVLTAAGANDVLIGGDGNDTLSVTGSLASAVTLTGGAGLDSFNVSAFKAANPGSAVTITDFAAGETIQFTSAATADFVSARVSLIEEATFTEYVTEAASIAGDVACGISWFQFNSNTFIVQNITADEIFDNGTDIIVKLTGLVDLSDSSFNADLGGTLEYIA